MALAFAPSMLAFNAPALRPTVEVSAVSMNANRNIVSGMTGKYSLKQTVYDPLNLASTFDNNWLREAELKHGRICMLGIAGFLSVDAGLRFPGKEFEGVAAVDAHDALNPQMWGLLAVVGFCELIHASVIVPKLDADW